MGVAFPKLIHLLNKFSHSLLFLHSKYSNKSESIDSLY